MRRTFSIFLRVHARDHLIILARSRYWQSRSCIFRLAFVFSPRLTMGNAFCCAEPEWPVRHDNSFLISKFKHLATNGMNDEVKILCIKSLIFLSCIRWMIFSFFFFVSWLILLLPASLVDHLHLELIVNNFDCQWKSLFWNDHLLVILLAYTIRSNSDVQAPIYPNSMNQQCPNVIRVPIEISSILDCWQMNLHRKEMIKNEKLS